MRNRYLVVPVLLVMAAAPLCTLAKKPQKEQDKAVYVKHVEDPVLKALEDADKKQAEQAEAATRAIVDAQKAALKKEREDRKDLRVDMKGLVKPSSPAAFKVQGWHFPPVAQYLTGTCWDFSTTSFFESEIHRLTGQDVKLSEMWTVYYEYLEKARRYIETRGYSEFSEGSESNAVPIIWKKYGVVPESAYRGTLKKDGEFDHSQLVEEMRNYLEYCKAHNYWNEGQILATLKIILNRHMGVPPTTFVYKGKTYTPGQFLKDVTKLKLDDYVDLMSTESVPFWTQGEYKVPDNWWHDRSYYNVPLKVWYAALLEAVKAGSTAAIGGDVSEPGYDGWQKVAIVPSFDIPDAYINQDSREMRIYNHTTTDDHGIHLVGWMHLDGHDWFLIKDSARAARKAKPDGYLYYRDDYVKLKMRTFMVNKSFVKDVLAKFPHPAAEPAK